MKKIFSVLVIFSIFILYGCDKEKIEEEKNNIININSVDGKLR